MRPFKNSIGVIATCLLLMYGSGGIDPNTVKWEQTAGPTGGRIDALTITQQGVLLSGGTSGGIYRSIDEGESWVMVNEGMTFSHITNLVTAGEAVYALTQTDGLFLSLDSGLSWKHMDLPISRIHGIVPFGMYQMIAFNSDSILIIQETEAKFLDGSMQKMRHVSATDDRIAVNSETGLYLYNVEKSSWSRLPITLPGDLSTLLLTDEDSLVIGTQKGALLKGGLHESKFDTLFMNPGKTVKTLFPVRDHQIGIIYEGPWFSDIAGGGYLVKEDGRTIEKITSDEADFVNDFILTDSYVLAAGQRGIFKSGRGKTFRPANAGLKNQRVNDLVFNHSDILFAGTYGGVFSTNDKGDTWMEKNRGLSDQGVLDLVIDRKGRLFAGTYLSSIFRSTNNGENWTQSDTGLPDNTWMISLAVNSRDKIYVATTNKGVYTSGDHGDSWQYTFEGFENVGLYSIGISPDDILYAGGIDGRVYISGDDGANWIGSALDSTNISDPGDYNDNTVIEFAFRDSVVFAGTASGGVFISSGTNGDWKNISYNLPVDNVRSMQIVGGRLMIGTNGSEDYEQFTGESIFLLDEENKKWIRADSGLFHTRIKALTLSPSEDYIYAGTWGGGVFRTSVSPE